LRKQRLNDGLRERPLIKFTNKDLLFTTPAALHPALCTRGRRLLRATIRSMATMAIPSGGYTKQMPNDELEPTFDEDAVNPKLEKASRAMLSPSPMSAPYKAMTGRGEMGSVWDRWVATQTHSASQRGFDTSDPRSMKERVAAERRARTARGDKDKGRFDSQLATGSGFTNTGPEATKARIATLQQAAFKEKEEVQELKELLGRTLYTGGGNSYHRAGDVATAGLQRLNDGQADDIAMLRRRRVEEETTAAVKTGRSGWDSSVFKDTPPALTGLKPVTPEPWARDAQIYEDGMAGHGFKQIGTGVEGNQGYTRGAREDGMKGKHVAIIENDMVAYRRELGGEKKPPVSARFLRSHGLAPPQTPKSGRSTGRSTGRTPPKSDASVLPTDERAVRIASRSPKKAGDNKSPPKGGKK